MGRIPQLDILRALAIGLVILDHTFSKPEATGFLRPFATLMRFGLGWTGVDLFFVLSGFLIGGLLMSELKTCGTLDIARFMIRRGFRIWPAYLVFIWYSFFAAVFFFHQPIDLLVREMFKLMLQLQNYIAAGRVFLWSLAVEEHFYILLPLLLIHITRRGGKGIHVVPAITAGLMVVCLALRLISAKLYPHYSTYIHHSPTHLRIDSLMAGVCVAYIYHSRPALWDRLLLHRKGLYAVGLVCLTPTMFFGVDHPVTYTIGYTGLAVGYACIMIAFLGTGISGAWTRPALFAASIGAYSYSIYLWHIDLGIMPAAWLLRPLNNPHGITWLLDAVLSVTFASISGMAMAKLIENPTLKIRDRLFPRIAGPFKGAQQTAVVARSEPAAANA